MSLARYVPPSALAHMQNQARRLASFKRAVEEQKTIFYRTGAALGTGIAVGYVQGRYDLDEVRGVPVVPVVGGLLHVAAFMLDDSTSEHLHNIGDACVAIGSHQFARQLGADQRAKSTSNTSTAAGGYTPLAA